MSGDDTANPIFVDPSGRRRRRVKRAAWLIVALGAAYCLLLVFFALAGVHVSAPGLPLVEQIPHVFGGGGTAPAPSQSASTPSSSYPQASGSAASGVLSPSGSPSLSALIPTAPASASARPSVAPTSRPTGSPTAKPTVAPTPTHSPTSTPGQIRSSTAPGSTHRWVTHP